MSSILDIQRKYYSKLDSLDLELLIAVAIHRPREFVLAHPEKILTKNQVVQIKKNIARRENSEPLAHILGQKEFFGLVFAVNRHTLIPRPETELLVEKVLNLEPTNKTIIDIGTGSGNIIVSLAKNIKEKNDYIAVDMSKEALKIAKYNAKKNKVDKKIKFLHGNLLEPIIKNKLSDRQSSFVIIANLPYLSRKIYASVSDNVKKYEPKSALYSKKNGLDHYERLFKQIILLEKKCYLSQAVCYMEISPEQKIKMTQLVKKYFPKARPIFHQDLAGKWRVCEIKTC